MTDMLDEADLYDFDTDDFDDDGFDDLDLDGYDDIDGFDDVDDDFDDDGFDDIDELDDIDAMSIDDDGFDDLDDFDFDAASGLYVPNAPTIISGPAATAIARTLQAAALDSLDADDADAFWGRLKGFVKKAARGVKGLAKRVASGVGKIVKNPAFRKLAGAALNHIQRIAKVAGPWGRVVAAGIGGARGLLSGGGWKGALRGAVQGALPGVAGKAISGLLRADGLDDEAGLDALADLVDAGQIPRAVALPIGAGLAARAMARRGIAAAQMRTASAQARVRGMWRHMQRTMLTMLRAARSIPGPAGRKLRILRQVARNAAMTLARSAQSPRAAAQMTSAAAASAARKVVPVAAQRPAMGRVPPHVAARRTQQRLQIIRQVGPRALTRGQIMAPAPA